MRELDWLILRKLYEKRSISKAAEDLYVTQSALTKRVKTGMGRGGCETEQPGRDLHGGWALPCQKSGDHAGFPR